MNGYRCHILPKGTACLLLALVMLAGPLLAIAGSGSDCGGDCCATAPRQGTEPTLRGVTAHACCCCPAGSACHISASDPLQPTPAVVRNLQRPNDHRIHQLVLTGDQEFCRRLSLPAVGWIHRGPPPICPPPYLSTCHLII